MDDSCISHCENLKKFYIPDGYVVVPDDPEQFINSEDTVHYVVESSAIHNILEEWNNEVIFLRKVVKGTADKSYGIYVGKMAGLPASVVKRSQDLMSRMQKDYSNNLATRKKSSDIPQVDVPQLNLFTSN